MRERSTGAEILDDPAVPDEVRERCYNDLNRTHRWIGDTAALLRCLRRDPIPVRSVIDIGCGHGALLRDLEKKLGITGIGIDLRPPAKKTAIPILRLDAIRESLPSADAAIAVHMTHHLAEEDVIRLIRNVGLSCRRFIILDLVRHWLPAALFRTFVGPFVNRINVADGLRSIERAFTPEEMNRIVTRAIGETKARFRHEVAPLYIRQIVDISY